MEMRSEGSKLRWFRYVERKSDDWVKRSRVLEVEGRDLWGPNMMTWLGVVGSNTWLGFECEG